MTDIVGASPIASDELQVRLKSFGDFRGSVGLSPSGKKRRQSGASSRLPSTLNESEAGEEPAWEV